VHRCDPNLRRRPVVVAADFCQQVGELQRPVGIARPPPGAPRTRRSASAPEEPDASRAAPSRSVSASSPLRCTLMMRSSASISGRPMWICRSRRPLRVSAGSRRFGWLHAATTTTPSRPWTPSSTANKPVTH
jgi:hypothetical protein